MRITLNISSNGQAAVIKTYELKEGEYSVGSHDCDVVLAYPTVSRRHGVISVGPAGVDFVDSGSRNGSRLLAGADGDKETMTTMQAKAAWHPGAAVGIGPFLLRWTPATDDKKTNENVEQEALGRYASLYLRLLSESPAQARDLFFDALASEPELENILEQVRREVHGDGPLHLLLHDLACREILVNSHDEIYADLGNGLRRRETGFLSATSFEAWAVRTAQGAGRRLDLQHPICEATLGCGARFHAVMPPISARGISVAIRRFGSAPIDEAQALAGGWLDSRALQLLREAVVEKRNIVISGGTSTGKTSLLNFLCRYLVPEERIVTVEDTVELTPPVSNLVQLQSRTANADGVGQVSLRQLVQCALRMRPDRIIVGECRGSEVLEMLQALNTGHPGSLTTVHANSTDEALERLELLALLGAPNLSIECIRQWIRSSVEVVIQVERDSAGHRHVAEIASKNKERGVLEVTYRRHSC